MLASDLRKALDPVTFAKEELNFYPDEWQEQVLRWQGKRLMLNCCRQSGKSTISAILALHKALYYPNSLILLISPSQRQSSELFKKVTQEFEKVCNPPRRLEDNRLSLSLDNKSRILSLPSSEATIRGFSSANLIIEDEASRVDDDLYFSIRPMLAVSDGKLILMSTPWGKRGHFFHEWTEGEKWERVKITAEECPRISKEFLEEERKSLGEWFFMQEYYCEFMENEDQLFKHDDIMNSINDEVEPLF